MALIFGLVFFPRLQFPRVKVCCALSRESGQAANDETVTPALLKPKVRETGTAAEVPELGRPGGWSVHK